MNEEIISILRLCPNINDSENIINLSEGIVAVLLFYDSKKQFMIFFDENQIKTINGFDEEERLKNSQYRICFLLDKREDTCKTQKWQSLKKAAITAKIESPVTSGKYKYFCLE